MQCSAGNAAMLYSCLISRVVIFGAGAPVSGPINAYQVPTTADIHNVERELL